jgi:hypothetical protein
VESSPFIKDFALSMSYLIRVLFLRILAIMNMWRTISVREKYTQMDQKTKATQPPVGGVSARGHFRISHLDRIEGEAVIPRGKSELSNF